MCLSLERASPGDQVHDQDDDRNDEQQVDERTTEMTDEAKKPQNQNHNKNSPEHSFLWLSFICFVRRLAGALKDFSGGPDSTSCRLHKLKYISGGQG
jgi:hypothetical protein